MVEQSEKWLTVNGFDSYEISNNGKVRRKEIFVTQKSRRGKIYSRKLPQLLKSTVTRNGYKSVTLVESGRDKTLYVHRIVAEHFVLGYEDGKVVNHKDGNKENNNFSNLEWVTQSENIQHAFENGLTKHGIDSPLYKGEIEVVSEDGTVVDILKGKKDIETKGYSYGNICEVISGKRKTHKGFTFRRVKREC